MASYSSWQQPQKIFIVILLYWPPPLHTENRIRQRLTPTQGQILLKPTGGVRAHPRALIFLAVVMSKLL